MIIINYVNLLTAFYFWFAANICSIQSHISVNFQFSSTAELDDIKNIFIQEKTKYQYLGVEKCASTCHNNEKLGFQYNSWKNTAHANAFTTLSSNRAMRYAKNVRINENPQESSACLKCHITGEGLDSSFLTATYKKEDGVTCEACHKQKFIPKTFLPKESDCMECHNGSAHIMHKFNFIKDCMKIAHPRTKT